MRRLVLVTALAVLGLLAPVAGAGGASAAGSGSAGSAASMESEFVSRLNSLRVSKGLAPLSVDAELTGIARRWAGKMASEGRIRHNPGFANEVAQNWVKLGENVGTGPDVKSIHDAFVASRTHYVNMIDGAFTRIGVGVVIGPNGAIYTAHQFMRLASDDAPARAGSGPAAPGAEPAARVASKPAASPKASKSAAAVVAPAVASKPVVVPARIALSLEQSQGRGL